MALYLLKAVDGEDIAAYYKNNLKSVCEVTITVSIDEVANHREIDKKSVVAVIVTPVMLKRMKETKCVGFNSFLDKAEQKIFLYKDCRQNALEDINKQLKKFQKNGLENVTHIELKTCDDEDTAEIKLRAAIRKVNRQTLSRPSARKFVVDPDTVTEGDVVVTIVLLEEDRHYTDIKVRVPTVTGSHSTPTLLRDGAWTLKLLDVRPGKHDVNVVGDGTDLGSVSITCVSRLDAVMKLLPDIVMASPVELLSKLFKLDANSFDDDLVDFIKDGTESCVILHCISRILRRGEEQQTLLHFCAKYNLPNTCKCILDRRFSPEMRNAEDARGRTPLTVAEELNHADIIRILKWDAVDMCPLQSPHEKKSFLSASWSGRVVDRDSGNESLDMPSPYYPSKDPAKHSRVHKQHSLKKKGPDRHVYDTIEDSESVSDPPVTLRSSKQDDGYQPPWDHMLPDGPLPFPGIAPRSSIGTRNSRSGDQNSVNGRATISSGMVGRSVSAYKLRNKNRQHKYDMIDDSKCGSDPPVFWQSNRGKGGYELPWDIKLSRSSTHL